ncbi:MAG TPA: DUF1761 domain-containing protein [Hyphomonadaceae bacterium]|nr:DUF1761 domain-containing protein [Hyphomonadaceae bacterium]
MPRVAGLNIVAVLVGAVAFYAVGMVIYGFTLTELWGNETLRNHGLLAPGAAALTGEALFARLEEIPGAMDAGMAYGLGFLISLVTVIGIAFVMRLAKPASLLAAMGTAFVLWLCFSATGLSYNVVYSSESTTIFMIDLMHTLIAFMLSSAVLFLMDGKSLSGAAVPAAA